MKQTIHIDDKESNQFYRENPRMFDQLIDIINTTTFFCRIIASKHKDIVEWITQNTPMLSDTQFKLITKIYWILHGLTAFPKCQVCGKEIVRNVSKLTHPKYKYCSLQCAHKSPEMPILVKETKRRKYGDETYTNREKFHETMKNIPPEIKQQRKQKRIERCLAKYGVEYTSQREDVKQKCLNTRHQRYNGKYESEESSRKRKQTFIDHYGVDNNMKSEVGMKAYIDGIRRIYNDDTIVSIFQVKEIKEKARATFNEHMKDDAFREKRKQKLINTSNERFGHDNYMNRTQAKQTCLDRYGAETPLQIPDIQQMGMLPESRQKANETKRRNGTFNTSKPEEEAYELLCERFSADDVIRQYRSEEYPFNCDFYIKSCELYIECNFSWTHGGHWYDPLDEADQAKLKKWQDKGTDFYKNAVETWTSRDVKKRQTALDHSLKYLVFWNLDELESWCSHALSSTQTPQNISNTHANFNPEE